MRLPKQNNIISYWKGNLDENGLFHDFVGSNHGTLVSAPSQVETPYGSALDFDGSADYVDFGTNLRSFFNSASTISISSLFKIDSFPSAGQRIFIQEFADTGDDAQIMLRVDNAGGNLSCFASNGSTNSLANAGTILLATWYHGVVTYDGGNALIIYLDSVLKDRQTVVPANLGTSEPSAVGRIGAGGHTTFRGADGIIAHTIIRNIALTPNEVLQEFNYLQRLTARR